MSYGIGLGGGNNLINALGGLATSNVQQQQMIAHKNSLAQLKLQGNDVDSAEAFRQFEGMFIGQLMQMMYETVPVNEMFGGGFSEQMYRSMLIDEYGNTVSARGGIGIAQKLQQSLVDFNNIEHDADKALTPINKAVNAYEKIYSFSM